MTCPNQPPSVPLPVIQRGHKVQSPVSAKLIQNLLGESVCLERSWLTVIWLSASHRETGGPWVPPTLPASFPQSCGVGAWGLLSWRGNLSSRWSFPSWAEIVLTCSSSKFSLLRGHSGLWEPLLRVRARSPARSWAGGSASAQPLLSSLTPAPAVMPPSRFFH